MVAAFMRLADIFYFRCFFLFFFGSFFVKIYFSQQEIASRTNLALCITPLNTFGCSRSR